MPFRLQMKILRIEKWSLREEEEKEEKGRRRRSTTRQTDAAKEDHLIVYFYFCLEPRILLFTLNASNDMVPNFGE